MPLIALITDFGLTDWFAGEMKGVIQAAAADVTIIDITHGIPFGDNRRAAFTLAASYRSFPPGTVFCVAVDPGACSIRKPIAADTGVYRFVGPDSGVLSWMLYNEPNAAIRAIDNSKLFRAAPRSTTFHGRDILGPVAAHLAAGVPFADVGTAVASYQRLSFPRPIIDTASITTEIIATDRFGNLITSIDASLVHLLTRAPALSLRYAEQSRPMRYAEFYQEVPSSEPLCYLGSAGFVEIAINRGSAADRFGLRDGDRVELRIG